MGLRPAFTVEAGAADVTRTVEERLVELRLTLTSDRASDTLELTLEDDSGALALPSAERELRVALGYRGAPLRPMGVYYHDESEVQLAPRQLTVRATAADFRRRSALKAPRRRSWDDVSLGDLVRTIAAEHGYTGHVAPPLADIVLAHIDQTAESDLHLLRRLARQYDATTKAAGGSLIFAPRGSGRSAGTRRALPVIEYAPGQRGAGEAAVLSARLTVRGRPRYGGVTASYQDVAGAELVHVRAGTGTPVYTIREPFPDRPQAEAAAAARLSRLARQTKELAVTVTGNPPWSPKRSWCSGSGPRAPIADGRSSAPPTRSPSDRATPPASPRSPPTAPESPAATARKIPEKSPKNQRCKLNVNSLQVKRRVTLREVQPH